jgi:hypothetical protein
MYFCFAQRAVTADERQKIIIAASFHDIGIWTKKTLDYIEPSIELASQYLQSTNRTEWIAEISLMIGMHHKFTEVNGEVKCRYPLVECFRKADLIDLSNGLLNAGIERSTIHSIQSIFPNRGFQLMLVLKWFKWMLLRPWNPFPFMRY